ncbi:30S ribosomal protein S4 [Candidatus Uhrbacteria bacterium]|nr:30S ribosomal protein S4 [Candidatus Uhrbacteria bacterium]
MAKAIGPKCRMCRRAGTKLFLKGDRCFTTKCEIVKRNYPPGVHGAKVAKPRLTPFGIQLKEKQKARIFYRISEKQLQGYYVKAGRKKGNTADIMLQLLEMRLDNAVYRLGWARSHDEARQFVSHGFVYVNGKKVTIPSYQVRVGEVLTLKPGSQDRQPFQTLLSRLEKHTLPAWLYGEHGKFETKIAATPKPEDTQTVFDMRLIIEFYSR